MKTINPKTEIERIVHFIQNGLKRTGLKDIVIGWSGGVDSTVCLYLLARALPPQNIHVLHMPYDTTCIKEFEGLRVKGLRIHEVSIKKAVDTLWRVNLKLKTPFINAQGKQNSNQTQNSKLQNKTRLGNIMARVRMIVLFDYAKKVNGLVCGTENKSEHLLGYFTRYGDGASDLEPIQHLFKTQVYELARYLKVPESIVGKKPSANLWEGQTDEGEFGFTYEEADEVLSELREDKGVIREYKGMVIEDKGEIREDKGRVGGNKGRIREKILERVWRNRFKKEVPYTL